MTPLAQRTLGIVLLSSAFVALFSITAKDIGLLEATVGLISSLIFTGAIVGGIHFILKSYE